jgi:hypothetical protein
LLNVLGDGPDDVARRVKRGMEEANLPPGGDAAASHMQLAAGIGVTPGYIGRRPCPHSTS